jgi:hypothetical protein
MFRIEIFTPGEKVVVKKVKGVSEACLTVQRLLSPTKPGTTGIIFSSDPRDSSTSLKVLDSGRTRILNEEAGIMVFYDHLRHRAFLPALEGILETLPSVKELSGDD